VSSADTDADDNCSPARSASRRRNCAPVHTSRCAAASRSLPALRIKAPPYRSSCDLENCDTPERDIRPASRRFN
jgi:hypothetical protein